MCRHSGHPLSWFQDEITCGGHQIRLMASQSLLAYEAGVNERLLADEKCSNRIVSVRRINPYARGSFAINCPAFAGTSPVDFAKSGGPFGSLRTNNSS